MKKGDLIRFIRGYGRTAIVVSDIYHKREWGDSGHPDDITIVSKIDIRYMDGQREKQSVPLSRLGRNYVEMLSKIE